MVSLCNTISRPDAFQIAILFVVIEGPVVAPNLCDTMLRTIPFVRAVEVRQIPVRIVFSAKEEFVWKAPHIDERLSIVDTSKVNLAGAASFLACRLVVVELRTIHHRQLHSRG